MSHVQVILRQRVAKLGQMGDVLRVKAGYARNFLLPKGFADRATADKIAEFEAGRAQLEARNLELKKEAQAVGEKMAGLTIKLVRPAGESGHLYGSVRSIDLADAITDAGFSVSRQQVHIKAPIKTLGVHSVDIELHPEVHIPVTLAIALTAEEAAALVAN